MALSLFGLLVGCNKATEPAQVSGPSEAGKKYLLAAAPDGAKAISIIFEEAKEGDDVIAMGTIDTIAGASILLSEGGGHHDHDHGDDHAHDHGHDHAHDADSCPFCSGKEKTPSSMAVIQIAKEGSDEIVTENLDKFLGLKSGQSLVVKGKRGSNEVGSLVILASAVYVKDADGHDHAHGDHDHGDHDHGHGDHDHGDHDHKHGDHDHEGHDHKDGDHDHDHDHKDGDHDHKEDKKEAAAGDAPKAE